MKGVGLADLRLVLGMLDRIEWQIREHPDFDLVAVEGAPIEWEALHRFASEVRFSAVTDA